MFRCTECNTEYEVKPDFCECGNDVFIEIDSSEYAQEETYSQAAPSSIFEQNSINPQEEYSEEEEERFSFDTSAVRKRKVSIAVLACSIIIAIALFCLVGNGPAKVSVDPQKVEAEKARRAELAATIPDVDEFWDNTPPYGSGASQKSSLPLINDNLGSLDGKMKDYMVSVGKTFAKNWKRSYISGSGICTIEFTINKDGSFNTKKIYNKGNNEKLSDSVNMLLSHVTSVEAPPPEYHGERIHLNFRVKDNGEFKVYYP